MKAYYCNNDCEELLSEASIDKQRIVILIIIIILDITVYSGYSWWPTILDM